MKLKVELLDDKNSKKLCEKKIFVSRSSGGELVTIEGEFALEQKAKKD
jgi:hypothetical protein